MWSHGFQELRLCRHRAGDGTDASNVFAVSGLRIVVIHGRFRAFSQPNDILPPQYAYCASLSEQSQGSTGTLRPCTRTPPLREVGSGTSVSRSGRPAASQRIALILRLLRFSCLTIIDRVRRAFPSLLGHLDTFLCARAPRTHEDARPGGLQVAFWARLHAILRSRWRRPPPSSSFFIFVLSA